MLVPYVRNALPAATYAPQRPPATGVSFVDYLRRGGRMQPIHAAGDAEAAEVIPLMPGRGKPVDEDKLSKFLVAQQESNRCMLVTLMVALGSVIAVAIGLSYFLVRLNQNMEGAERLITPHAATLVNATADMLRDMGKTSWNLRSISAETDELAAMSFHPADHMVNESDVIATRLASFMRHPRMSVDLGDLTGR